ncbi:MAG TPA: sialidase family protein [Thermoanaerobaculia bacterium]|nr:sialidase family protein [Thermoanaerobaculia bacterium]
MFRLVTVAVLVSLMPGCAAERKEAASAGQQPKQASQEANPIETLPSPAGAGAAEPFLYATRDSVLLSWLEPVPSTDRVALRFARYDSGQWSAPRTIVERNDLFVNWADFPSIVEDSKGTLFAHWLQKSGKGTYSYDVQMAASTDGGATWGKPFLLNRDGKQAEHGFVTLAALPDGGVGATWLDGRNMTGGGHGSGGHDAGGDMSIRYAIVDASGNIANDVELDGRTCECCTTGMTMASGGPVIVYRDRSPKEVRDIAYVAKTANGWTKPARVNADDWKINACPVNGPQADAIGKRVVTAWFTAAQEKGRAYAAFSDDGGVTFGKPVQIDDGKPIGRLDVLLLDEETALVTWLEQTPDGGEIRARRVSRNGKVEPAIKIADSSTARAAGFARMARRERDVYFTWTEQSADSKRVHIARSRF